MVEVVAYIRTAVSYLRTSSAANVGADKDSAVRQREAINQYAAANNIEVVHEYYDAAVSGADPVSDRPGFMAMLEYMNGNGARIILVENATRFARDLMVQEIGYEALLKQGIALIAVDHPESFTDDSPTAVLIRQILGAVAQFEKTTTVAKLKGARNRQRAANGRCEGRKQAPEVARALAVTMHATGASLRAISRALAEAGFLAPNGAPYLPESIKRML